MIDAPALMHDFLVAQPELTALTAGRIWAERAEPPTGYRPTDGPGLAFRIRGGEMDYSSALMRISTQFKCYGTDEAAANALYRTLVDVLHDNQHFQFLSNQIEVMGQTLYEQDKGWPYVLCFFSSRVLV